MTIGDQFLTMKLSSRVIYNYVTRNSNKHSMSTYNW